MEMRMATTTEFIGALPALLGFVPSNSLLFSIIDGDTGASAVTLHTNADADDHDLKMTANGVLNTPVESGNPAVVLTAIADEPQDVLTRAAPFLTVPILERIAIQKYEQGQTWHALESGDVGQVPDYKDSPLTTEVMSMGRVIVEDRMAIHRYFEPIEPPIAVEPIDDVLDSLVLLSRDIAGMDETISIAHLGGLLTHSLVARGLAMRAIEYDPYRAYTVFTEAATRLRGPARVEALTAAAVAAFVNRDGALSGAAQEAAIATAGLCDPPYEPTLAVMLMQAHHCGITPDDISRTLALVPEEGTKRNE